MRFPPVVTPLFLFAHSFLIPLATATTIGGGPLNPSVLPQFQPASLDSILSLQYTSSVELDTEDLLSSNGNKNENDAPEPATIFLLPAALLTLLLVRGRW